MGRSRLSIDEKAATVLAGLKGEEPMTNLIDCGRLVIRPLKASSERIQGWPLSWQMLPSLSPATPKSSSMQRKCSAITEW